MLIDDLHTKKQAIEKLALAHGANNVRIFGSVSRKEENINSDIDVLVTLPKGYDLFSQRLALSEALCKLTGQTIDLVPEHELNHHIGDAILNEAVPL